MKFSKGDKVQSRSDPSKIGMVEEIGQIHAGLQYYRIFWGGIEGTKNVPEIDLLPYTEVEKPLDNLIRGNIAGYKEFQRLITYLKLSRDFPLRNNIYAFNASRTRFYPYQFKPLIKFLESTNHRLLICDEVGLGKTIEAGLILTELRARHTIHRVLVVCPANLTTKWKLELKKRFGEDFEILQAKDFIEFLNEYQEEFDKVKLNGIISLESIRSANVLKLLESVMPSLDLVIIDEAHHMRNFGRRQRTAGIILGSSANAMIMLTATPIHLGNENLFSLLNILDEEDFPDLLTTDIRLQQNEPIVSAQTCMGQFPPKLEEAIGYLEKAENSPWIKENPLYYEILSKIKDTNKDSPNQSIYRRQLIDLQKDLSELNLIGHIFTRTRKKEVHENTVKRSPFAIEIAFSQKEKEFYDAVTNFVTAEGEMKGSMPLIKQWRLNMPQRRMASSIPAMVEYYQKYFGFDTDDHPEDFDETELESDEVDSEKVDYNTARKQLQKIVSNWSLDSHDSKYDKFITLLRQLRQEDGTVKIIVFAFFKGTLNYLHRRLQKDGFGCLMISGDVDANERPIIIERFQSDSNIEVLLSSRVGSEGLDFQFCNIMVNYDLPWNPMEVEQRIGRLDRIGQESPIIRIYNLWSKDTIEERILKRLYERIHIFERSIGELEGIIGDVVQQLERNIFSKTLTQEEQEKEAERAILVIETKVQALERLEEQSAQFIGTDAYFIDEVESIKSCRRYVTGEQLRRFIVDFIKGNVPRTRLEYDHKTLIGKIYPDENLSSFIVAHRKSSELGRFLSFGKNGIEITFDSQIAFSNPKMEFINVLHPLVVTIVEKYNESNNKHINAQYFLLRTNLLPKGFYYYMIFRLRVSAAKERNTLECIILNERLEEVCDLKTAEAVFGEMVEKGEESKGLLPDVNPETAIRACQKAINVFLQYVNAMRKDIEKKNDMFVDRRLISLQASYEKNIKKQEDLLSRAEREEKQERYIRMLKGTISRLKSELKEKQNELEQKRKISVEYDEIATGILEVEKVRD